MQDEKQLKRKRYPINFKTKRNWNLPLEAVTKDAVFTFLNYFLTIFGGYLILPLFVFGNAILYHSLHEIKYATSLTTQITNFEKTNKKAYGMIQE